MAIREITTGQDSFLDIVANLVGVLIILVVVVGAQATSALEHTEPDQETLAEIDERKQELYDSAITVTKLQTDNHALESKIRYETLLALDASEKRHRSLVRLEVVRQEIQAQREQLNEDQKTRFDIARKQAELQDQLDAIIRETNAVTVSEARVETIDHYPTPIAKTVFQEEVHFRLVEGRLDFIPVDDLLNLVKSEWEVKAQKLARAEQTIETVGPVDGFRMRYQIVSKTLARASANGSRAARVITINRATLLPVSDNNGESVTAATQNGSNLNAVLRQFDPRKTTVTVWVYPDSFREFNLLKDWLHERSFRVASRPRSQGQVIGFSPNGSASVAQ